MLPESVKRALRFYFITDDGVPGFSPLKQVETAVLAGATLIQYRNKRFTPSDFGEAKAIRDFCKCNRIPFVVNDNTLLAMAVGADGVHLGQEDESPATARSLLGPYALIGVSVSTPVELDRTDLGPCDYIGTGPVFSTHTKKDAKAVIGLSGLETIARRSPLPVVAIGGIGVDNAASCFKHGAAGVSVISCISRAEEPALNARRLSEACGCTPRERLCRPWDDEFRLIEKLIDACPSSTKGKPQLRVTPGDDAALLYPLSHPVITTDTHKEGVHFILDWQTPQEVGKKAVIITLSDLAACFATPVGLFVNLALPAYVSDQFVEALYRGIHEALNTYGCTLGGGNISRAAEFSIDLFAVGQGRGDLFPARSKAAPGDGLYTTGPLGLARLGLACLVKKETGYPRLISKFKSPSARFDAAEILASHQVACAMDISDGLAGDAGHIARASTVTIEFDLEPSLFDPDLVSFCEKHALDAEREILQGGEDYELLFTCRPEVFEKIRRRLPEACRVGRCLPYDGNSFSKLPEDIRSFQHGEKG
jgi:thiamin-phosphate kinase